MNIGAQTWFYWPVTVALSATVTGGLLYRRAFQNGRPAILCALGGVAALALPVVPLALATQARCNDTGQRTLFEPSWALLGAGMVAWAIALSMLFRVAGELPADAMRTTLGITIATSIGFWLEFWGSQISLMTYCNDTVPALRWVHLGIALGVALLGAAGIALWARSSRSLTHSA